MVVMFDEAKNILFAHANSFSVDTELYVRLGRYRYICMMDWGGGGVHDGLITSTHNAHTTEFFFEH